MMEQKRFEFILEAKSPIAHHAETFGNSAVIMRRKVRMPDGSWTEIPCVSGDTMRHGLREAGAYAVLDAAGLLDAPALGEAALRLLFAGGMVTGRGDAAAVNLADYRELVELIPPLALLGGCASNRVIPGRMQVDDAVLVCEETVPSLPAWVAEWLSAHKSTVDVARMHVEEVQRVRMDPTLDPGKRKLLGDGAALAVETRLLAGEVAHETDDAQGREEAKSSMMPRRFERIAAGSLFYWSCSATCYSDLDKATLLTMLAAFLSRAQVGGKRGTGHGQLWPIACAQAQLLRPRERPDTFAIAEAGAGAGEAFWKHVSARKDRIGEYLRKVNA